MKKYKVVTDNLDWYHLPKGRIVAVTSPGEFKGGINHFQQTIEECMLLHPDWFEEIKEKEDSGREIVILRETIKSLTEQLNKPKEEPVVLPKKKWWK